MRVIHERCCGLDVHKKTVTACVLIAGEKGKAQKSVRTFRTVTEDLLALGDWLDSLGVTHVAMESTGVYWRPVFNVLEDGREVTLVNAQHIKAVPGRKTDVRDSEWIADLLRHGLLRASFIPPAPIRELRELTRYRKTLIRERSQEVNRLRKVLEGANIKLGSVATDALGVSARRMLDAMLGGERDPEVLADLGRASLRGSCRTCGSRWRGGWRGTIWCSSSASWRTSTSPRSRSCCCKRRSIDASSRCARRWSCCRRYRAWARRRLRPSSRGSVPT